MSEHANEEWLQHNLEKFGKNLLLTQDNHSNIIKTSRLKSMINIYLRCPIIQIKRAHLWKPKRSLKIDKKHAKKEDFEENLRLKLRNRKRKCF